MQPQDYKIWVGAELLGCTRGRQKKVLNAMTYRVMNVEDGQVQLEMAQEFKPEATKDSADEEEEEEEILSLSLEETAALMRPTHCLVYYTAQGRTLRDKNVLLLDVSARYFTLRHFIVGVSRATSGARLSVASVQQQDELMRQETAVIRPNPIRMQFGQCDFLK